MLVHVMRAKLKEDMHVHATQTRTFKTLTVDDTRRKTETHKETYRERETLTAGETLTQRNRKKKKKA